MIFNAANLGEALSYIGGMFGFGNITFLSAETVYYLRSYAVLFVAAIVGSTPVPKELAGKLPNKVKLVEPVVWIAMLLVVTAYLVDGSFNPFLYFRF